ncbi:MAG TPA: hemolysin family protein [Bacteroidales bacterium]|nr:hemolysin family protein [Bacteroidales bacterium]
MEILIITLLLLLNGIFAMFEIALVSSRKSHLQDKAQAGSKGAKTALLLLKEPEKILSAIQIGITLVGILSGAFGGLTLADDLASVLLQVHWLAPYAESLSIIIVVGLITYFSLIIGELVPKTIALNNPERIAVALSPAMKIIGTVVHPVVWFLSASTKLVLYIFRIRKNEEAPVSEEELRMLLKQGSETGVIKKEESEIISEVIRFGDKRAGSIMTHRRDVEWIDSRSGDKEILALVSRTAHSRLPVCEGTVDEVAGIAAIKDILAYYIDYHCIDLDKIITEPLYLPEQIQATKVLEKFRQTRNHFGIVINEYGTMEGIVTLHDVAENIMGDLPEPEDSEKPEYYRRDDGSLLVDGSMILEDVEGLLNVKTLLDENEGRANINTIAGLILYKLNRIPQTGDKLTIKGFMFEVVDMDGNRIDKLLINPNR